MLLKIVLTQEHDITTEEVQNVLSMHASFIAGEVTNGKIVNSDVLEKISNNLSHKIDDLSAKSRTAKLWIQYIQYVNIVKLFIATERTGNWHNHLTTVTKMLNLFAATGDINFMPKVHDCAYR